MENWKDILRDWVPIATFLTAAAALWASFNAFRQLRLARGQFSATHRPELVVPLCEIRWRVGPGADLPEEARGLGAQFTVVNKGASEARIIAMKAAILLTDPQNVGDHLIDLDIGRRTLASGERIEVTVFVDPDGGGAVPFIRDTPIRCVGRVTYADENGRQRETGFARLYDAAGKRWVSEADSQHDYAY